MRIIDADILKKEVKTMFCPDGYKIMMLERIDKAPELGYEDGVLSVENAIRRAIELEDAYNNGWSDGFNEGENERPQGGQVVPDMLQGWRYEGRPQGEWKVKALSTFPQYQPDEYFCPFCNTVVNYKTNFCPNCGAYMKGD